MGDQSPISVLVDGMNLIGSRPDRWWKDRRGAMLGLVEELRAYAEVAEAEITVVFDGAPFELGEEQRGSVEVRFAARRGRNAADEEIERLVSESPDPSSLRVITSDRALADSVSAAGAQVEGAGSFRRRLDQALGDAD